VTDGGLASLAAGCPNLTYIVLVVCKGVTANGVMVLVVDDDVVVNKIKSVNNTQFRMTDTTFS
jgi:hypothetical protein